MNTMCDTMQLRVDICRLLSEDLQGVVWEKYIRTHLLVEAKETMARRKLAVDMYTATCETFSATIPGYLDTMIDLWVSNPVYFGVLMYTVEERILEDYMSEDSITLFLVFSCIRDGINGGVVEKSALARELLGASSTASSASCSIDSETHRICSVMRHVETIHYMMFPYVPVEA